MVQNNSVASGQDNSQNTGQSKKGRGGKQKRGKIIVQHYQQAKIHGSGIQRLIVLLYPPFLLLWVTYQGQRVKLLVLEAS